jgi:hypothetical protein
VAAIAAVSVSAGQAPGAAGQAPVDSEDASVSAFVEAVELAIATSSSDMWDALLSSNADRAVAARFFESMAAGAVTRAVVRERERLPLEGALPGEGFRLIVDVFTEAGARGRITTWRLDIRRPRETSAPQPWRILDQETLSSIDGLHRLSLQAHKQFAARDLVITSVDLELRMRSGDVFVAETIEGVTTLILIGNGTMAFAPAPSEERGQVRLFAGTETLDTSFSAAYVRLNPFDYEQQVRGQTLTAVQPDARTMRRAQAIFDDEVTKSFSLDLRDLSRDNWSLLPQVGDFLAEVRTRRFGTLTFARSTNEAEDVSLFHRQRRRNIAAYASEAKLLSRGRFYNEDDLVDYDILDHNIDATFSPTREWLDGRSRMKVRVKSHVASALTLRLAQEFTIQSIGSTELGRLMFLRVRNQDTFVVNLPAPVPRGTELTLNISYAGRIRTQSLDQESVGVQGAGREGRPQPRSDELPFVPAEPNWLFSNRSQWYPQGQVTDYSTATIRFTVPAEYAVVASGVPAGGSPVTIGGPGPGARSTYVFTATQPLRYLGVLVSRFHRVDWATVVLDIEPPDSTDGAASSSSAGVPVGGRNTVMLTIEANRRQQDRGRDTTVTAAEILRMYAALTGDAPYEAMTVAMVEHERPGGHSPGYFAVLNNPLPVTPYVFRNDPAMFTNFPEFYLAHEIAHQWWGQAVGWKNYREQWLSEGFAQYFAALYARERRGEQTFRDVLRQFRRWSMEQSDQGAIHLGYRLGHIKNDSRVFRALVYNKGALVLHMLRRWIGDDAFFDGVRRYYAENRFKKAGTHDLQRAMEAASGRSLDRFFERWIYESGLPRIRYSTAIEDQHAVVRFEQVGSAIYDLAVTVSLNYGAETVEEVVAITEPVVEARIPLTGTVRTIDINADHGALGVFERR